MGREIVREGESVLHPVTNDGLVVGQSVVFVKDVAGS